MTGRAVPRQSERKKTPNGKGPGGSTRLTTKYRPPVNMNGQILTLDLGNTTLSGGVWEKEKLLKHWTIPVEKKSFGRSLRQKLAVSKERSSLTSAILSSVVPVWNREVLFLCRSILKVDCHLLSDRTPTGLRIRYRHPEKVGADRIANAVGVYHFYGAPAIVVDFGTAITFDVVSKRYEYLGGVIAPGLGISTEALFQRAALLPRVRIAVPKEVLGRETAAAIRSGVYFGTLGLVERIIHDLKKELHWGREVKLVATGGHARLILSRSKIIRTIDPFLTLKGLYHIAREIT